MPSESPAKTRVKRRHNPISQSGRRLRSSNGLATPDPSPSKSAQVVELTDTETDGAEIVPMPRAEIIRVHSDNEREFIHSIKAYLASTRTLPDESDELVALKQSEKELKKKLKATEKRLDSIQQAMEGKVLVDESKIFNLMVCVSCNKPSKCSMTLVNCGHSFCRKCIFDWFELLEDGDPPEVLPSLELECFVCDTHVTKRPVPNYTISAIAKLVSAKDIARLKCEATQGTVPLSSAYDKFWMHFDDDVFPRRLLAPCHRTTI